MGATCNTCGIRAR